MIRLTKWYLDLTGDDRQAVITYWARLDAFGLSITWASCLHIAPEGTVHTQSSLRPYSPPTRADDGIHFRHSTLDIHGLWTPIDPPHGAMLYESDAGVVDWHCLCPRGEATVHLGDQTLTGLGYVEQLTMTIEPWRLPIADIYWGRFLSAETGLVWIRWDGDQPLSLVLCDGKPTQQHVIGTDHVTAGDAVLALERVCTIRHGRLGPSVLDAIPGIDQIAPLSILNAHETKWLSRGVIGATESNDAKSSLGWAIHEHISFATRQREHAS